MSPQEQKTLEELGIKPEELPERTAKASALARGETLGNIIEVPLAEVSAGFMGRVHDAPKPTRKTRSDAGKPRPVKDRYPGRTLMSNEELAALYIKLSGKKSHTNVCATSCSPAETPGPCDCDAPDPQAAAPGLPEAAKAHLDKLRLNIVEKWRLAKIAESELQQAEAEWYSYLDRITAK